MATQIEDEAGLEQALDQVAAFLEAPPEPGSPQDAEFGALLAEIERYRPSLSVPEPPSEWSRLAERADDLAAQASEFQQAREAREDRERLSSFPEDGRGIGPTTGV